MTLKAEFRWSLAAEKAIDLQLVEESKYILRLIGKELSIVAKLA
jgi:hypothetical protein